MTLAASLGCGTTPNRHPVAAMPAIRKLKVVSGDTGDPVASAIISVNGRRTTTNGSGLAIVAAAGPAEIVSAEFLPRRTSTLGGVVTLWPRDGDYGEAYVRALVYQRGWQTRETATGPDGALRRIDPGTVAVVPEPRLWNDPAARAAHEQAAAGLTAATDGRVTFVVTNTPGSLRVVWSYLDGSLPAGDAITYRDLRGDAITGARIRFGSADVARSPRFVAHELGHALGLEHSIVTTDVMYYAIDRGLPAEFSGNERRTIRLLLQRVPGNRFPDVDPSA